MDCEIAHLDILDTLIHDTDNIRIHSCKINQLIFKNVNNLGFIFLSDLPPLDSWIKYFRTQKIDVDAKMTKYYNTPVCSIQQSNLGNTQFINCDLSAFARFEFINSKILECFLGGTTIPDVSQVYLPNEKAYEDDFLYQNELLDQRRLLFGQIKNVYANQGDKARSIEAQAVELECYRLDLGIQHNQEQYTRKYTIPTLKSIDLIQNRQERFMLWMSKSTSSYGTDWLRAAMATLIGTLICYSVYCILIGYKPGLDMGKFLELSSHSLSYLNPLRDEDSGQLFTAISRDVESGYISRAIIDGKPCHIITPWARIGDNLNRILVAYLVYQTIQSFRKLGRS